MPCALYCFKSVEIVGLFVNESIAWVISYVFADGFVPGKFHHGSFIYLSLFLHCCQESISSFSCIFSLELMSFPFVFLFLKG